MATQPAAQNEMRFPCGPALLCSVLLACPGPWLHPSKFFKRAIRPARGATDSYMTPMGSAPRLPKLQTNFWQRPPMAPNGPINTHQRPSAPISTHQAPTCTHLYPPPWLQNPVCRCGFHVDDLGGSGEQTDTAGRRQCPGWEDNRGSHRLQSSRDLSSVAARSKPTAIKPRVWTGADPWRAVTMVIQPSIHQRCSQPSCLGDPEVTCRVHARNALY